MKSQNFNSIAKSSEPSICIPRAFRNITSKQVKEVFEQVLEPECIDRIDTVERFGKLKDEKTKYHRFFIHLKNWPVDEQSQSIRQKLVNGDIVKIVYQEPWFWKCSASRVPKPMYNTRPTKQQPYILSDQEENDNPEKEEGEI